MSSRRLSVPRLLLVVLLCAGAVSRVAATLVAAPASASAAESAPGALPTPGAVNVRTYGARGTGVGDDTGAFEAAMAAAEQAGAVRYPDGPTGASQGVVYVPPGTYPLLNLTFPSNLRLEVDAGAVLEQAGGRTATSPPGSSSQGPAVVLWDGPGASPLTNVSLVGVGTASGGVKGRADPVAAGWSIDDSFTMDLDPQATDANNLVSGLMAINVDGFLVANVYSIQNNFEPATAPTTPAGWWPSSRKAALGLRARNDTPLNGPFYDPHDGTVTNWYNIDSPPGYGPNQIDSAHDVDLSQIYSQGGTALRLETDNSNQKKFGSQLQSITADDIEGVDCNRAVSFSPHYQTNHDVQVTDVQSISCYEGVVEALGAGIPTNERGGFLDSTLSNVTVMGGLQAQDPDLSGDGLWTTGTSSQAFSRDPTVLWAVTYLAGTVACSGSFLWPSDSIETTAGPLQPACMQATANPTVPSPPPIGLATVQMAQATVSFSPAISNGGSPITGYTVTSAPGSLKVSGTSSPLVIPNLTAGISYTFTVHATNAVGNGPESSPSNSVTASGPPPPPTPTGLSATAISNSRVGITWVKATGATSYVLSRAQSVGGPFAVIASPKKPKFTDSRLTPGTTYFYVVQAASAAGDSPPSSPVPATTPG